MFQETNEKLRECLLKFIPILDRHHQHSREKWLEKEMTKAAYEHVHQRFTVSTMLNKRIDVKDEHLVNICSEITVDIHSSIDLLSKTEKEKYNLILEEWYGCFKRIGYIDMHPIFKKPEKNLTAFEDFEKKHKK